VASTKAMSAPASNARLARAIASSKPTTKDHDAARLQRLEGAPRVTLDVQLCHV
jgi:hypothetical protein